MIQLSSAQLNYMIFRYVHESGFTHSAFVLGYEAGINKSTIDGNLVPPGVIVKFVQKGIDQYLELEINLNDDDTDVDEDFQFLEPLDLITKDVNELRQIIKEKKEKLQKDKPTQKDMSNVERQRDQGREPAREREKEKQQKEKKDRERCEKNKVKEKRKDREEPSKEIIDSKLSGEKEAARREEKTGDLEPMDICTDSASLPCEFPSSDVMVLEGHTSEVFSCGWSPDGSLLASRSVNVLVLKHLASRPNVSRRDVTTLDWNSESTHLATGSYDSQARIWTQTGFTHSAFVVGYEAGINESTIDGNLVPPGVLVKFVQKGIQYLELEINLNDDDTNVDEDFQFLEPLDLVTKSVDELRQIIKEKKEKLHKDKTTQKDMSSVDRQKDQGREPGRDREKEKQQKEKERERDRERNEKNKQKGKRKEIIDSKLSGEKEAARSEEKTGDVEPMDICTDSATLPCEFPSSDVMVLEGHTSEVFSCGWSPDGSLLASGCGDSTARLWAIEDGPRNSTFQSRPVNVLVLKHLASRPNVSSMDVTTLDWNSESTHLATGSYDGQARIWTRTGELVSTLNNHIGPIFSLRWNKKGDYLLSGSVDETAVAWDVKSGKCLQKFGFHSGPILDVDWRNNNIFASCSSDKMIYVCKVGENRPVKTFSEHQNEINTVKWDPSGSLLASCSDDTTAKEIYTLTWSPTGAGTSNSNRQLMLASASFDSTVKLWDVELGRCLRSLESHREPVYAVKFSPNCEYLASGSLDKSLIIWSVKEGKIVRSYTGAGGIFELSWKKEGNKVAACFADGRVCVFDIRM